MVSYSTLFLAFVFQCTTAWSEPDPGRRNPDEIYNNGTPQTEGKIEVNPFRTIGDSDTVPGMVFGDIRYPLDQKTGEFLTRAVRTWPSGMVPYTVDASISNRNLITQAIADIQSKSCVRFKERTTESDYVVFRSNSITRGCWSMIGRAGGQQTINLDASGGCQSKGVVIHEILHALGFFHEQSRTDRDNYVTINWSNVIASAKRNFDIEYNAVSTGDGYDYGSLMHYGARDFAINRLVATIIPKQNGVQIGQKLAMSAADINRLKKLYKCPSQDAPAPSTSTPQSQCYCPCLPGNNGPHYLPVIS